MAAEALEEHREVFEEYFKAESDARGVAKELRENEALYIQVRVQRTQGRGWRVRVVPVHLQTGRRVDRFDVFDNGYVLAFLTAWRLAAEGG